VHAKRLALLCKTCATCGSVSVLFNGPRSDVPTHERLPNQKTVLLSPAGVLGVKPGPVTIKVTSTGKKVDIDGLGVRPSDRMAAAARSRHGEAARMPRP